MTYLERMRYDESLGRRRMSPYHRRELLSISNGLRHLATLAPEERARYLERTHHELNHYVERAAHWRAVRRRREALAETEALREGTTLPDDVIGTVALYLGAHDEKRKEAPETAS
mmetsp:Transcript_21885/g.67154  ORF Transcript_21885/g.67154 Transcript_21885/m.67154 type:complete len:115 (-) Transcript_21885:67-411(-)|eukprot:CAMPEP_0118859902 /NCGR_PEP_ID=MMETSP1163-20130328/5950_1 /TAXON_ID=124430 /ORGANISM="Phaeomonas parva, Strain CCMP2877" /LENGTH=114 /DNA_ID=CAMNT_0006793539 /DNA_START=280 /DNA_END=624 /DNA_ORIENTATION=+